MFLFVAAVIAKPNNLDITITPYFGVEFSVFEEAYYFEDSSKYSNDICSMLEWEQRPTCMLGVNSIFTFYNIGFVLDVGTKLPVECGLMKDSDYWENGVHFNYSENENYLDKAFSLNLGFTYNFNLPVLSIVPLIEFFYSYNSFNAKNGHGWYAGPSYSSDGELHSWDSEYAHYFPDGKYHLAGVDYLNQTFYFMTGVELSKVIFNKWKLGGGFYLAPFTYVYAKDHHLGKRNDFYTEDFIYNFFQNFKFCLKNTVIVNKNFSIVAITEGNLQLLVKGDDYENGYRNNQKGGESYKAIKVKLGTSFSF